LALIALFPEAPDEILAMSTKGRLSKEKSHEFMSGNLMDLSAHSPTALSVIEGARSFLEDARSSAGILRAL
jgi:hypothetical protein